ncbi:hypothetical protein BDZ88DRAFT_414930 [Geranomyces variabilis]|nr:hypothetical protein BDZ88DRAFT_414930 [Geranomyces variabilis]KAJ3141817.1 hypothetical protein HDU90_006166 [Geranomyces variabilis]
MSSANQSVVTQIRKLDSAISTFSRPFTRSGLLPIGIRMTSVKLANNDIVLISPTPLDQATEDGIKALGGTVKYLICPNVVHHLFIEDYKRKWPDAKVIGVKGLPQKHKSISFDGVMGVDDPKTTVYGFENDLAYRHFGASRNQDTAYFHKDTKTLIQADLMFNLPPTEQYPGGGNFGFLTRFVHGFLKPETATHKFFTKYAMSSDSRQMTEDVKFVADNWKIERIVPAHGNIIENGGEKAFREAYAWYF